MPEHTAGGERRWLILHSAYFPREEQCPPKLLDNIVRYSREQNMKLVMGCDANAHIIIWDSTDINNQVSPYWIT